jgi:hypothetical protein
MKTITSIKKVNHTVYINFSDGSYACRSFESGKWNSSKNLSNEILDAARSVAYRDGKWMNWTAPRETRISNEKLTGFGGTVDDEEDARYDLELYERSAQKSQPSNLFDTAHGLEG